MDMSVASSQLRAGQLPVEATTFVDRRHEVAEVKRLLAAARLVTLTGIAGSGKTRLAQRVANELRRAFADGARWVDLDALADDVLFDHTIAHVLGVQDHSDRPVFDAVVETIRDRQLLLVLDNCEHLLDRCAAFVAPALREVAGLRVLCTSRQPLGTLGEQVWTVPPLPAPVPGQAETAADRYPAVALFTDRAAAAAPGFRLTGENERAVVEICHRLDGLPLAIELAAAQLRTLPVQQLATGLRDQLHLLSARGVTPARHRSLETAFTWSYELCSPAEQALWGRLSVFAESFDLAAAEYVCAGGDPTDGDLVTVLSGLVDKSVLMRDDSAPGMRYALLGTVRQFARDRLRAGGDRQAQARRYRHRDWYLRMVEQFRESWFGADELAWFDRIRAELPNIRSALDFCFTTPDESAAAAHMIADLAYFWRAAGAPHEGRYWFERALAAEPMGSRSRLRLLPAYAHLLRAQGDHETAAARATECLALAEEFGDPLSAARGRRDLGLALLLDNDVAGSAPLLERAAVELVDLGEPPDGVISTMIGLSMSALFREQVERAHELCDQNRARCAEAGDHWWLGQVLHASAYAAQALGDTRQAQRYVAEGLRHRGRFRDTIGIATAVEWLAWIAGLDGDHERAARLLGAADRLWRTVGTTLYDGTQWLRGHDQCMQQARRVLGDRAFESAFHHGTLLATEELLQYAQGADPPKAAGGRDLDTAPALTRREREVAGLIAEGLSNKEIAARLVTSRRTAESHVENILRKLGFTSRTQVAAWVAQQRSGI
jgi:non-specific serine/threonine protein kinase